MTAISLKLFSLRLSATLVDVFSSLVLGLLLSQTGAGWFFASRAVVMLKIGSPDTIWKGSIPMIMGYLGLFFYVLPLSFLIIFTLDAGMRGTPGKKLFKLKILSRDGQTPPEGLLWKRTLIKTMLFWGLTVSLLSGWWVPAVLFLALGLVVPLSMCLSLFTSLQPVHDAFARTSVVRA